ncbi:MAG: 2-hydroxyacyl-CoA dehydratase, partial [Desulfomonilia bacterium]|nr:2-hydroxyacyl-CoA dehydratase [Desulfomonilia bacterium]
MEELQRLSDHLRNRLSDLAATRGNGTRIVGYTPGGYLPEELVLAAGAVPLCMIQAGDRTAVESSEPYICRWIDPFCRAQIGLATSGKDPYYSALDLLVVPVTDNHIRAIADVVDYNTDLEVFPFGVPHMKEPSTFEYYLHGLARLKGKLEELTGTKITDEGLRESIRLCNRERELFRTLSTLRQSPGESISGSSFIALNHASLVSDKHFMVELLESVAHTVMSRPRRQDNAPRILLTGSTLAMGDTLPGLIEESGGLVVIEEFAEGIRPYW